MQYKLFRSMDVVEFETIINGALADGWTLQGSSTYTNSEGFLQAMTKEN